MRPIPDGEGEIAEKVLDAVVTPRTVCSQNQFRIRDSRDIFMAVRFQFCNECRSCIYTTISHNPCLAIQTEGLLFFCRLRTDLEQRMAQTDFAIEPNVLSIWTAELLKIYQSLQQFPIDRGIIKVDHSGKAAHEGSELRKGNAASKAA